MIGILFDKKPSIIKPWNATMSYEKNRLTKMPIQIKLLKINVRYWGEKTLRIIVGYLCNVIKFDIATLNIDRMWYARVLVEMDI